MIRHILIGLGFGLAVFVLRAFVSVRAYWTGEVNDFDELYEHTQQSSYLVHIVAVAVGILAGIIL